MAKNNGIENQEPEINEEKQPSSFELIWKLGFEEIDGWAQQFNKQDELFLEAVKNYVDRVKRNQENIQAITDQFGKELKNWEKTAREELLATTTTLQHFYPVNSYEEINQVVDDIQTKTTSLLGTPARALAGGQALDQYLTTVEKYISFRKVGREKYTESVKKTTNILYENQKLVMNLFTKQMNSAIFPFQKYLKNATETSQS